MARRSALTGSLVVHGAIALMVMLARCRRPEVTPDGPQRIAIDLVAPAPLASSPPPTPAPVSPAGAGSSAGGSPEGSPAPPRALRHTHAMATHAASSRRAVEPAVPPEASQVPTAVPPEVPTAVPTAVPPAVPPEVPIEPPRNETGETSVASELDDPEAAAGAGLGGGSGLGGRGGGIGAGIGAGGAGIGGWNTSVVAAPLPVPPAPEPARLRARPPRLIYPARDREVEDSRLFVARLTIDADGFVIGVRLVRGVGGVRDDQAANAVWRFRYSPALDDDGRPIRATIEQRFLVD